MPTIVLVTDLPGPIDRCFDLARSIDCHTEGMKHSREQAVAGVTTGLARLGDEITWRARHLGITQHLTSRITLFEPPVRFADAMVRGAFRSFHHEHLFEPLTSDRTRMTDTFTFTAPLGVLGHAANALFLTRYMRRQLTIRNTHLCATLGSGAWRRLLPPRMN